MTALRGTKAEKIVSAIAGAAERWRDADFPPRVRVTERIAQRTSYSIPVVEYALDRLFQAITRDTLEATIASELGSLDALDGFAARENRPDAWAAPVGRVCVISSRTTIGVALFPAIFALCAKNDVVVKDREDALTGEFFATLAEERDEFSQAARASAWSPENESSPRMQDFDAVVAFGSDETLARIRAGLSAHAAFIGYGSRASAGYVGRESLESTQTAREVAKGAARDVVLYEGEGCLSLHVLFVERGGAIDPIEFGRALAQCIEEANVEFPIGERSAAQTAALAHYRKLSGFRSATGAGAVFGDEDANYTVVVDHPASQPPQFLPRAIGLVLVDAADQALEYVRAHRLPLEAFALAPPRDDIVEAAVQAGAVCLARFGELQQPPLSGDHGGRPRIAQFVRWIDRTL